MSSTRSWAARRRPLSAPPFADVLAAFALLLALTTAAAAAGDVETELWEEILEKRVNDDGEVAYRSLARHDRQRLTKYLASLSDAEPDEMDRDEAVSFWVNAYNAMIVFGVIHGENPKTLEGRGRLYHWFRLEIAGERRTPDEVVAKIDRYATADPRIHFAHCNGTRSAPRLAAEPYDPDHLDAMLAVAARDFVSDPRRNRFDVEDRAADLSPIFDWYEKDFRRNAGSLVAWLRIFVQDEKVAEMLGGRKVKMRWQELDWTLNAQEGESLF